MSDTPREKLLADASGLIANDRQAQYGPPTDDFKRTAALLNAMGYTFAGEPIKASDVALILSCVKLSRIAHLREKQDSWVDLAGYTACGWECVENEARC